MYVHYRTLKHISGSPEWTITNSHYTDYVPVLWGIHSVVYHCILCVYITEYYVMRGRVVLKG